MASTIAMERDKVLSERDKRKSMSDTTFSMNAIKEAFPVQRFGSVKSAQYEAFRFLSRCVDKDMTMRRVRSIWEGTARRIDGEEKDALRRAKLEEARREQQLLRARLAELDAALAADAQA
ncbi:hypothetical protein D7027_05780 [Ochrobactrum intermedium]|nr:hypothetical protein [Brucella intermedia]